MYFFIPVVIFIMRQMARTDELIFRLLGLRFQFWVRVAGTIKQHEGAWVFSPNFYRGSEKRGASTVPNVYSSNNTGQDTTP